MFAFFDHSSDSCVRGIRWFRGSGEHKKETYAERRETLLDYRFCLFELLDCIIGLEVRQVENAKLSDSFGSGL